MGLVVGREFEFQTGSWNVKHRRLLTRLAGAQDWEEFGGTCSAQPLFDGNGNIEDNFIDLPDGGYRAVALRSFDAEKGQWAIWWLDGRNPHHLDVPVIGNFVDGVGRFYADDLFAGKQIKVKFEWSGLDSAKPRWEQAFSEDGGLNWETNWTMEFERQ